MILSHMKSREKEALIIRQANRASAVGKLMLGEYDDWYDFLKADIEDLESLPRRMLKARKSDIKKRLSGEIGKFCGKNFVGMNQPKLSSLYERIKADRGLEMSLECFEVEFAKIKTEVLRGHPKHATVEISLWGLKFKYPEHFFANDIVESLTIIQRTEENLDSFKEKNHAKLKDEAENLSKLLSEHFFASRICILCCFNLVEAFLNGLAWDFSKDEKKMLALSNNQKKIIQDGSIRNKLLKYPDIIGGSQLWTEQDDPVKSFLEKVKPYRDSLVHPSPFSAPEKFGGYDKLQYLYRIDAEKAKDTVSIITKLIQALMEHIYGQEAKQPEWFQDFTQAVKFT